MFRILLIIFVSLVVLYFWQPDVDMSNFRVCSSKTDFSEAKSEIIVLKNALKELSKTDIGTEYWKNLRK
jgi:hypothetical protein